MRPRIVLKALADLSVDVLNTAATLPVRAGKASRRMAGQSVREVRLTLAAAGRQSQRALNGLYGGARSALRMAQPWTRGGLNE